MFMKHHKVKEEITVQALIYRLKKVERPWPFEILKAKVYTLIAKDYTLILLSFLCSFLYFPNLSIVK